MTASVPPSLSDPAIRNRAQRAAWAAAVASVCFGASVVATRYVVAQTTPLSLAFLRYLLATACLLPVVGWRAVVAVPTADRWRMAGLGVLFFGVFPWSFSASLTHLPSAHVAMVVATNPLVTLLLSRVRGVERIGAVQLMGQLLAFAGLVVALPIFASPVPAAADAWIGYLEIATTVLCGSIYNVFSRPLLGRYPPLVMTTVSMIAGTLFLAPLAAWQGLFQAVPVFTPLGWAAVLFLGIAGGAVGFGLWIWALQRSTPSRVAVFLAINPITAILLGALLLGESVTARLLVGLLAVIGGILLATRRPV